MVHLYYVRRMRLERFVSKAQPLVDHTGASRERQHTLSSKWCVCVFEKGLSGYNALYNGVYCATQCSGNFNSH